MKPYEYLLRNWLIILLCLIGFSLNLAAFYPGFISSDGLDQYAQALNNKYDDWHPPILAYTWHIVNYIHKGPLLMLVLQLGLFWLSCFLMASAFQKKALQALVFLVFAFAPFIQNFTGWIVKDTLMGLSWLLAGAIMFNAFFTRNSRHLFSLVAAAVLLLYGTWMRYNAITALLPMTFLWASVFFAQKKLWQKVVYAVCLLLVIIVGQPFFNNVLLKASKNYTEAQIYFHDLTGIFVATHQNVYPAVLYKNPQFDTTYIRANYDPLDVTKLLWNHDNKTLVFYDANVARELKKAWIQAIKEYPSDYLKLRYHISLYFLNIKPVENLQLYYIWIPNNNYGFHVKGGRLYTAYVSYLEKNRDRMFFKVWFWTVLSVLLFVVALFVKNKAMRLFNLCLSSSAFLYIAPQCIVSNSVTDFRYIYWSCLACTVSLISFGLLFNKLPVENRQ